MRPARIGCGGRAEFRAAAAVTDLRRRRRAQGKLARGQRQCAISGTQRRCGLRCASRRVEAAAQPGCVANPVGILELYSYAAARPGANGPTETNYNAARCRDMPMNDIRLARAASINWSTDGAAASHSCGQRDTRSWARKASGLLRRSI